MIKLSIFLIYIVFFSGCVTTSKYDLLKKNHDEVSKQKELCDTKIHEQDVLIADLQNKLGLVSSNKTQIESKLSEMRKALDELSLRKKLSENRIQEYRELTHKFRSFIDSGQLKIKLSEGRMLVELKSDVLFQSGSAELSATGKQSIIDIASQLANIPNKTYQIEGHTDNIPIHNDKYPTNWELAAQRAINVVKEMTKSGLSPERVSGASYGEFKPIQDNKIAEGRSANRRIQIILMPDLSNLPGQSELENILQKEQPLQ